MVQKHLSQLRKMLAYVESAYAMAEKSWLWDILVRVRAASYSWAFFLISETGLISESAFWAPSPLINVSLSHDVLHSQIR